eukprot:CAMPEP_0115023724 /NCGR_PEP_ID=MMETSP0216-20121206/32630_1 /TAXON_ID=223996 /ORGANISM="Protocruzia adherens, Strain Boccale" /LENGTH=169 /DNA_ID=CAMNT_0002397281 /DNA_START=35 /DNA_END=544 /DNA_ORIENTATION=-
MIGSLATMGKTKWRTPKVQKTPLHRRPKFGRAKSRRKYGVAVQRQEWIEKVRHMSSNKNSKPFVEKTQSHAQKKNLKLQHMIHQTPVMESYINQRKVQRGRTRRLFMAIRNYECPIRCKRFLKNEEDTFELLKTRELEKHVNIMTNEIAKSRGVEPGCSKICLKIKTVL